MALAIVKPIKNRVVRVSLEITPSDLAVARAFDSTSLRIVEDGKTVFQVAPGMPALGMAGAYLPFSDSTEKIVELVGRDLDEAQEAFYATVARVGEYLSLIEEQVKATVEAYEKAKKDIKEV